MTTSIGGTTGITFNDATTQNTSAFYGGLAMRNRIINGAMVIDQRNAGTSVTVNAAAAFYAADRFRLSGVASSGVFTGQQVLDAPAGFVNSLKATVTTTDASLAGSDLYYAVQNIEGFNTADLAWGSASAAAVTLSFWVKSSITGTFGGALSNNGVTRSYPFTYTISVANTWEYKTITIAGDTTGTWTTDNTSGIRVYFGLGIASGFTGTSGAWAGSQLLSATGAVNLMATNNATWQITGVQLEKGSTATSFDYRPVGTELALCQRYYCVIVLTNTGYSIAGFASNTTSILGAQTNFPVTMRSAPVVTPPTAGQTSNTASFTTSTGNFPTTTGTFSIPTTNTSGFCLNGASYVGLTAGTPAFLYSNGNLNITASSEL